VVLVLATSPQKPPTTYTWVNDFRPHRTRFLRGGATYTWERLIREYIRYIVYFHTEVLKCSCLNKLVNDVPVNPRDVPLQLFTTALAMWVNYVYLLNAPLRFLMTLSVMCTRTVYTTYQHVLLLLQLTLQAELKRGIMHLFL